jgi:hypothetical protein
MAYINHLSDAFVAYHERFSDFHFSDTAGSVKMHIGSADADTSNSNQCLARGGLRPHGLSNIESAGS